MAAGYYEKYLRISSAPPNNSNLKYYTATSFNTVSSFAIITTLNTI
jgi:hypothetical protein